MSNSEPNYDTDIYIADTLGELGLFYRISPFALIGRSLSDDGGGGHNPIEPASLGTPVMTGAHHFNFAQVFADLMQAGACITTDENILADDVGQLLVDVDQRTVMGAAGAEVVQMNRGAKQRSVALVEQQLSAD